jgi:HSP20 family protein
LKESTKREVVGMTLVKWEPFRDLITMQDRVSRLFDETLSRVWKEEELQRGTWTPAVDVVDRESEIILKVDLPEMSQSEIDLKVEENTLTIKGERKFIKETPEETYLQIERPYGVFHRQFTLPKRIDQEKIKATYKDGVLRIVLPKKEEVHPKPVSIEVK